MINLIPKSAHRGVVYTYWVRVLTIWSVMVVIVAVVIMVLLIPPYILITTQLAVYADDATAAASQIQNYDTAASELVAASQRASFIREQSTERSLLDTLEMVERVSVSVVTITSLSAIRNDDGTSTKVSIAGVAPTRQALVQFNETLEAAGNFSDVVPGGNLIVENDIPFTLNFTVGTSSDTSL